MKNIKNNSGQIALVVLILSAIIMTLGLSVAKKSVVDTKITTDEELLKKAFNTAESGIDYYLQKPTGGQPYVDSEGNRADITVNEISGGNLNVVTLANDLSYTWLVGHKPDETINYAAVYSGTLDLCVDTGFKGALKVDYFYRDSSGNYGVKRLGFNVGIRGFVVNYNDDYAGSPGSSCTISGTRKIGLGGLPVAGIIPLLVVVKPIGGNTKIAVQGNGTFPVQATEISSLGTATGVKRNVKIINQYQLPSFLLDAITAGGNVTAESN